MRDEVRKDALAPEAAPTVRAALLLLLLMLLIPWRLMGWVVFYYIYADYWVSLLSDGASTGCPY